MSLCSLFQEYFLSSSFLGMTIPLQHTDPTNILLGEMLLAGFWHLTGCCWSLCDRSWNVLCYWGIHQWGRFSENVPVFFVAKKKSENTRLLCFWTIYTSTVETSHDDFFRDFAPLHAQQNTGVLLYPSIVNLSTIYLHLKWIPHGLGVDGIEGGFGEDHLKVNKLFEEWNSTFNLCFC